MLYVGVGVLYVQRLLLCVCKSSVFTWRGVQNEGVQLPKCIFGLSPASPASSKIGPAGSTTGSPKPFNPGLVPKQERTPGPGSILNLNLGQFVSTPYIILLYIRQSALEMSCIPQGSRYCPEGYSQLSQTEQPLSQIRALSFFILHNKYSLITLLTLTLVCTFGGLSMMTLCDVP